MSVSVPLLSTAQAQAWADRFWTVLAAEAGDASAASSFSPELARQSLSQAWGFEDWSALVSRPVPVFDEGDTAPLHLTQVKRWIKSQREALSQSGHMVSLTLLQRAWARLLGASGWPGVAGQLAKINRARAAKLAQTPSLPHRDYPLSLVRYPFDTLPEALKTRLMLLGQRWAPGLS